MVLEIARLPVINSNIPNDPLKDDEPRFLVVNEAAECRESRS